MTDIINKLKNSQKLTYDEFLFLLNNRDDNLAEKLKQLAVQKRKQRFGNDVFVRGLIEFTNYCKNNCYYCGIRAGNASVERYRLSAEEIWEWRFPLRSSPQYRSTSSPPAACSESALSPQPRCSNQ